MLWSHIPNIGGIHVAQNDIGNYLGVHVAEFQEFQVFNSRGSGVFRVGVGLELCVQRLRLQEVWGFVVSAWSSERV